MPFIKEIDTNNAVVLANTVHKYAIVQAVKNAGIIEVLRELRGWHREVLN